MEDEGGGGEGGMKKSEGFNAKEKDVCKTDVGLCSENGTDAEDSRRARQLRRVKVVYIQPSCLVMKVLTSHNRHSL